MVSKKTRNKFYKKATYIEEFKYGLCCELAVLNRDFKGAIFLNLHEIFTFPELSLFKPQDKMCTEFWWPTRSNERLLALAFMIAMSE